MTVRRVLAALILVLAVAAAILIATFDPKPRIMAAIRAATGREVALNGPIGFSLLPPSVTLRDVTIANPPGFASPNMAAVRAITLRVDLGALLHGRVLVRRLVLDAPDVTLERSAAGVANWEFVPSAPASTASPAASRGKNPAARLAVLDAQVLDGALTYRDDRDGRKFAVGIPRLALST
ncbi:MAG: AsmA family protein, partial [Acetobacteraceae bacterium]